MMGRRIVRLLSQLRGVRQDPVEVRRVSLLHR